MLCVWYQVETNIVKSKPNEKRMQDYIRHLIAFYENGKRLSAVSFFRKRFHLKYLTVIWARFARLLTLSKTLV